MDNEEVWVFGYGSLVWRPGFRYSKSMVGYIPGFERRFWQGNDHHRGTPGKLGRVATLIESQESITWGRAFLVDDEKTSRDYLDKRESTIGGYATLTCDFYPEDPSEKVISVLVYIALPENPLYLGSAPSEMIAKEISESQGHCGPNVEYLARLAAFMRHRVPHVWDDHLFELEYLVRRMVVSSGKLSLLQYFDNVMEEGLESEKPADQSDRSNSPSKWIRSLSLPSDSGDDEDEEHESENDSGSCSSLYTDSDLVDTMYNR